MACPAAAGKVRCPLKPKSMKGSSALPRIYPSEDLLAAPPKVGAQQTVTISGSSGVTLRQEKQWGSQDWFDRYNRRTPNVESGFGNLRMPGKQHMTLGRIMVMGRAKISFLLAFYIAAVNLRLIDSYLAAKAREAANPQRLVRRRRKSQRLAVPYADRDQARKKQAGKTKRRQRTRAPDSTQATA